MLQVWTLHSKYQEKLGLKMLLHREIQRSRLVALDKSISKLYLLNLDSLLLVIKPLHSDLGRPAKKQQGIIRSLVLMLDQQVYSITKWAEKVASDPLLFDICGFEDNAPSAASYYDFLVRLWLADYRLHIKRKLKAGQKQPPKHSGTVKKLVAKAIKGKLKNFCPEIILQKFHCSGIHLILNIWLNMPFGEIPSYFSITLLAAYTKILRFPYVYGLYAYAKIFFTTYI